ncbi:MAG: transketolase [Oligoflexia bacterium]|nr:transketolase [Oligoflexia bacterium]
MGMEKHSIEKLKEIARDIRVSCIKMIAAAGSGHPGGSLSLAEIVTAFYFRLLRHDPKNPNWKDRDRFVLSKGHGVPALYAAMAYSGYFPVEQLMTLRQLGSPLQGHPDRARLPGIEASTGSLGQGLSIAQGIALATRIDGSDAMVYCVMGDGEIQEGQVWEAAMSVPMHKLDHVCAIIDWNKGQIDGQVKDVMNIEPIADKWKSFGWNVLEVDGHDLSEIIAAVESAKDNAKQKSGKPTLIVADTLKGKGVKFMEDGKNAWHGSAPNQEQTEAAINELLKGKV